LYSYDSYCYLQNLPLIKHHTSCYNLRNNQQIRTTYQIYLYKAAFVTRLRTPTLIIILQRIVILIRIILRKLFTLYNITKYLYYIRLLTNNLPINYIILFKYTILVRYIFFLTAHFAKRIIVLKKSKSLYNIVNLSLYYTVMLNYLSLYYLYIVIGGDSLPIIFRYLLLLYLPYNLAKITQRLIFPTPYTIVKAVHYPEQNQLLIQYLIINVFFNIFSYLPSLITFPIFLLRTTLNRNHN